MQGGKSSSAVGAAKEAAANVGASAWSGKEKTKAVVQETVEKLKAHDPAAKASAEARKQERIHEVEAAKRDAMRHNAAAKERATEAAYHPAADAGHGAGAIMDRNAVPADAVEMDEGTLPVVAATTEPGQAATTHDVPRASSDHGYLPDRGVRKSDDYLPARGTAGGHSA